MSDDRATAVLPVREEGFTVCAGNARSHRSANAPIYLVIRRWVAGGARRRQRTRNPQVVNDRRPGRAEMGSIAATPLLPNLKCALYLRFCRWAPGIRTPNLRIKSLVRRRRSAAYTASELRVCVSLLPIVPRRFPFIHGEEAGKIPCSSLSFLRQRHLRERCQGHVRRYTATCHAGPTRADTWRLNPFL